MSDFVNPPDPTSEFFRGDLGGLPFAIRPEALADRALTSRADLDDLPQGWVADEPIHLTLSHADAAAAYTAMGAKEGHGTTRTGVALPDLHPRPRRPHGGVRRRPVVAVLDTVVQDHEWIGGSGDEDAFWRDAREVPDGWRHLDEVGTSLTVPLAAQTPQPKCAGHGTFITGIIRQLAPDATVLSLPVMDAEGHTDDRLVPSALRWLVKRVQDAADGRPELAVDVVNLSWGRYLSLQRVVAPDDPDRMLLEQLGDLGVRVVASAGNRATDRPVPPAAWSAADDGQRTALKGVGALDASRGPAVYSNRGTHVRAWAPGTALVSTLPHFDRVPPEKLVVTDEVEKVIEDPNLQLSTFGRWGGTSFAAAWVSGRLAATLLDEQVAGDLLDTTTAAMKTRATRVWAQLADEFAPPPGLTG
jgi:serine protease